MSNGSLRVQKIGIRRRVVNGLVTYSALGAAILVIVPLVAIFGYLLMKELGSINWAFLTQIPKPVGEKGGGMGNAIVGSGINLLIASLFGIPLGIGAGIYLAEYGRNKFGNLVRFTSDVLNGVPSIVIGIFAYGIVVLPVKRFSALAGGVALGLLMIPIVVRTTEELLRLVPPGLREGALALGATRTRAVFTVIVPSALPGIMTGVLVATARVAGETAPLLFTSFNNHFWSTSLMQPIASLTVQVFTYAISPYEDWHRQAWAGAFLLVMIILALSIVARLAIRGLERMNRP